MFTSLRIKYFKKYFSVNVYRTLDTKSVRVEDLNNTDSITSLIFIEISEDNCKYTLLSNENGISPRYAICWPIQEGLVKDHKQTV